MNIGGVESEKNYASVSINVQPNKETNKAPTKAAKRAGRIKRKEAVLRSQEHLQQYSYIATAGKRFTESCLPQAPTTSGGSTVRKKRSGIGKAMQAKVRV